METFDLVIIGSGAGLNLINKALQKEWKTALIENSKFGGTCLTKGCIPSKVLVYPADVIREAEHASKVGVHTTINKIDWALITKRMWSQIDESKSIESGLAHTPNLSVFKGIGEFTGKYTMKVKLNDTGEYTPEFKSKRFGLAGGGRSIIPPISGLNNVDYLTTETFFGSKFPPTLWKSLTIIGGGIIAAEFAHIFSAFGVKVTIIEMLPQLVSTEEPEISQILETEFKKHMIVLTNTRAIECRQENYEKIVKVKNDITGEEQEIYSEALLIAAGRRPNTDILQAQKAGIKMNKQGWIKTNLYLETNIENIWAIGDITGKYQFRHKANHDADILSRNLFTKAKLAVNYAVVPWAIFTYPQIAHVGMTEKEAVDKGYDVLRAIKPYSSVAKGFAMGLENPQTDGLFKFVIDKSYQILGASAIGPHAALLIQQVVYLMNAGYTCEPDEDNPHLDPMGQKLNACPDAGSFWPLVKSMVIHPSLNEVAGWALGNLEPVNPPKSHDAGHHH